MSKYRRYRKYYKRRRGVWSTRIDNFSGAQSVASNTNYSIYYNLCTNPAQNENTVSNKYTVKNVNCQIQMESDSGWAVENLQVYIIYVPQGYVPTGVPSAYQDLPFTHPEWIMAHRFYGSALNDNNANNYTSPTFPPLRLSSRLARKLDTGDRICLLIIGTNKASSSVTLDYQGLVKYNTKAN